jgi:hypothetical protein
LHSRGALASLLTVDTGTLQTAIALGEEWLGPDSDILKCLRLGVALHHGALPTAYRKEVERLLRDGVLKVTISSPTLAQGLNLSATAVVMHSLYRHGEKIKVSEFKNVIGRAGRAYVDVEGLVLHPIFRDAKNKKHDQWVELIEDLGAREMESGLIQVIFSLLNRMLAWLGGNLDQLIDYVVNNAAAWAFPEVAGEKADKRERALKDWERHMATLDTAILSLIGEADVPDDQIEAALDNVLQSSLWQRRLLRVNEASRAAYRSTLLMRSQHIWANSTATRRRGYFLAGLGLEAGHALDATAPEANNLLIQQMAKRVTTAEFIERSNLVHGDRYDYSLAEYRAINRYVTIICAKHGPFQQSPANHYQGKGCAECGGSKPHSNESFINAAQAIHGDRYNYSMVKYHSNKAHVTIVCPHHGPFSQIAAVHLRGTGCPGCGGNRKHSTDSFIEKARSLQGERYDYSLVIYTGAHKNVRIICPHHGPFLQSPTNHLARKGCPECGSLAAGDARRKTTEHFIAKASAIHHNRYDYSLAEYLGSAAKISIICSAHGPFKQTPSEHLIGSGCAKCGVLARAEARRKTTEEFIYQSVVVHSDRYDYSLVEYLGAVEKVTIVCPDHGPFEQTQNGHLGGKGCYECGIVASSDAKRSTTERFVAKARMVHGERYDYTLVDYVTNRKKIRIICPDHGPFLQSPNDHVDQKSGCASCAETGFNPSEPGLLYYIAVTTDDGETRYKIGITNYSVHDRFPRAADQARIRVVKTWQFAFGRAAVERESEILYQFAADRYYGPRLLLSGGNTELFTRDILGLDLENHEQSQPADPDAKVISRPLQSCFDF